MNNYGTLTQEQGEVCHKAMLERLKGELRITKYAQKSLSAPKNAGDVISYRKSAGFSEAISTTALTEGVAPSELNLNMVKISSTVKQYGDFTKITDKLLEVGLDPMLVVASEEIGIRAGEKTEAIALNSIMGGTNIFYGGDKTARNLLTKDDKMSAKLLLRISTFLKKARAKQLTLEDGTKGYICLLNPAQAYDLKQDPDWKAANTYVNTKNIEEGEIGKYMGITCVEYDYAPILTGAGAASADVYQAIVLSEGFFGLPDIEGSSKPEIIIKNSTGDSSDTSNPLNQYSTVGFKMLLDCLILDNVRGVRIETGSTY